MDIEGFKLFLKKEYNYLSFMKSEILDVLTYIDERFIIDEDEDHNPYSHRSMDRTIEEVLSSEGYDSGIVSFALTLYRTYKEKYPNIYELLDDYIELSVSAENDKIEKDLYNQLSLLFDAKDTKTMTDFFAKGITQETLDDNEGITITPLFNPTPRGVIGYLIANRYNIRIKSTALIAIALALDTKLKIGVASSLLMIMGLDGKTIARVDASKAEACLIMEAMYIPNREISNNVLERFKGECVHNDLNCRYNKGGFCTISSEEITSTLDDLCSKGVFSKSGSVYKYYF